MDPFSALGVAANIAQFVQLAGSLLGLGWALYKDGSTAINFDLALVTKDMNLIAKQLRSRSRLGQVQRNLLEEEKSSFQDLLVRCEDLSQELIALLEGLSVDSPGKKWQSLYQAMRTLGQKDRLEDMQKRLDRIRDQMNAHMMFILGHQQHEVLSSVRRLQQECETLNVTKTDFLRFVASMDDRAAQRQNTILERPIYVQMSDQPEEASSSISTLSTLIEGTERLRADLIVLNSLRFRTIDVRRAEIKIAHSSTFEWIFNDGSSEAKKLEFASWLRDGQGWFWISGKPGSGKSTLCKFLANAPQTRTLLDAWAGEQQLFTSSYFFWRAGTDLQKSLEGLLRTIVFDILRGCPDLIAQLFTQRWQQARTAPGSRHEQWTKTELLQCLRELVKLKLSARFFFIIDGLDEYDGSPRDAVEMLTALASSENVKLCISSRPWNIFLDAFGHPTRMLRLQDWTRNDIRTFVADHLGAEPQFRRLQKTNCEYQNLLEDIVDKAEGVFLWVFLVVRELLDGLTNMDTLSNLHLRLQLLPSDLEEYFQHILDSVDPIYKESSAQTLLLCIHSRGQIPVTCLAFLDEAKVDDLHNLDMTFWSCETVLSMINTTERRLNARCKGLVEIQTLGDSLDPLIRYLHRTVQDFLELPEATSVLKTRAGSNFAIYEALLKVWTTYMRLAVLIHLPPTRARSNEELVADSSYYAMESQKERKLSNRERDGLLDLIGMRLFPYLRRTYPMYPRGTVEMTMLKAIHEGLFSFAKLSWQEVSSYSKPRCLSRVFHEGLVSSHVLRLDAFSFFLSEAGSPGCYLPTNETFWPKFLARIRAEWNEWTEEDKITSREIVKEFIRHGARIDFDVTTSTGSIRSTEILQKYLSLGKKELKDLEKDGQARIASRAFRTVQPSSSKPGRIQARFSKLTKHVSGG